MAKDFRADRLRTNTIIGTGSTSYNKPHLGLLFYSSSHATNFGGGLADSNMLATVGNDAWLVFSGSRNNSIVDNNLKADGSAVLFLGDVVVSGTLWSERSIVEVDNSVVGNLRAPNKIIGGYGSDIDGYPRFLVDPTTPNGSAAAGRHDAGTVSFNIAGGSENPAYPTTTNKDVFFHVSGSRGVRGTNDRGLALFDGDVFISGNLALSPVSTFSLPAIDALTGSDGTPWIAHSGSGNAGIYGSLQVHGNSISGSSGEIITFSGVDTALAGDLTVTGNNIKGSGANAITIAGADIAVAGVLKVSGNTIQASDGGNTIVMDTSDNVTIGGDIQVSGNGIKSSAGTTAITLSGVSATVAGDLRVNGNDIKDSSGNAAVSFDGSQNTTLKGTLRVDGNEIKDGGNARVLFLSGSGNATFDKNLTVVGDLNVSGSVTTIGTENLRVKDALIILASGSTTNSTKGGIAIASGSTIDNNALVFGTAEGTTAPGAFRAGYMDVQDGAITNMDSAQPVNVQAAGLIFKNRTGAGFTNTFVTASINSGATELKIQNNDGSIFLTPATSGAPGVEIANNVPLYLDGQGGSKTQVIKSFSNQILLQHLDAGGVLVRGNTAAASKVKFLGDSNYIYTTDEFLGLCITGSRGVNIGSTQSGDESGIILSASSEEPTGGPVLVLSASDQFNGSTREGYISVGSALSELPGLFTTTRYRDVRTLLSGSTNSRGTNTRGVTLISGDMMVSGSARVDGALSVGSFSLANLTLTEGSDPGPFINFRDTSTRIRRNGLNLEFVDGIQSTKTLTDLASLSVVDNTNVFSVAEGEPSYVKTSGSFSFDTSDRHTTALGNDVYFFVSGAIGSDGGSPVQRATALFGGDVHVSGTLRQGVTLFTTSLNTAYRTADVAGGTTVTEAGAGAIIDTNGSAQPVQIRGGSNNEFVQLGITGSMDFVGGGSGQARIKMTSAEAFGFHGSAGEVFRLVAGTGGAHARFPNNNQLRFQDDTRYLYGLTQDTVKKLSIRNTNSGGVVQVHTNAGRMEVTGSVFPGADNTYNLGSPEYRWANVYTGDLHLRNDRGNWTIYEEPDMLVVVNNLTGKKYKMGLTPLEDQD